MWVCVCVCASEYMWLNGTEWRRCIVNYFITHSNNVECLECLSHSVSPYQPSRLPVSRIRFFVRFIFKRQSHTKGLYTWNFSQSNQRYKHLYYMCRMQFKKETKKKKQKKKKKKKKHNEKRKMSSVAAQSNITGSHPKLELKLLFMALFEQVSWDLYTVEPSRICICSAAKQRKISNRRFAFLNLNNPYAHILLRVKSESCFYCFFSSLRSPSVLSPPFSLSLSLWFLLLFVSNYFVYSHPISWHWRVSVHSHMYIGFYFELFFYGFEFTALYQHFSFPLIEICICRRAVCRIANKSNNLKIIEMMCFCAFCSSFVEPHRKMALINFYCCIESLLMD